MKNYNKNTLVVNQEYQDVEGEYIYKGCSDDGVDFYFNEVIFDDEEDFDKYSVDDRTLIRHSNELRFY